jgi:hypothetical protein
VILVTAVKKQQLLTFSLRECLTEVGGEGLWIVRGMCVHCTLISANKLYLRV